MTIALSWEIEYITREVGKTGRGLILEVTKTMSTILMVIGIVAAIWATLAVIAVCAVVAALVRTAKVRALPSPTTVG